MDSGALKGEEERLLSMSLEEFFFNWGSKDGFGFIQGLFHPAHFSFSFLFFLYFFLLMFLTPFSSSTLPLFKEASGVGDSPHLAAHPSPVAYTLVVKRDAVFVLTDFKK